MLRTGGEFYVLALFSLLGQMVMISGNNLLSIYLGLELMSLSLYALVALRRDHAGVDRGGDEVLRPRRAGFRFPAVRHLDAVRRHRHAGPDRNRSSRSRAAPSTDHPDLRPGVPGRRPGVQAGRGAVPHVGAGRLPRFADGGHAAAGRRAEAGRLRASRSACWSKACCRWRWTGSRC